MLAFTTGVKNEASAAAVGQAMAEQIRDEVSASAAWELVEEFTATSIQWIVLRCLSSENDLPANFYAVIGRTISTGELRFSICETYDEATNTMQHIPKTLSGSQLAFDAQGRVATTQVLGTSQLSTANYASWTPSGTSSKYWLIVAEDGFTVAFNGAANGFVHIGAYIPLSFLPNTMPIQIIGSSMSGGGTTRNVSIAGTTGYDVGLTFDGGHSTNVPTGALLGFRGRLDRDDRLQGPGRPVAEQGMTVSTWLTQGEPLVGWALGKQKRMRVGANPPATFVWGDTYTLEGSLWVPYLPTDSRIFDTGVPV